MTAKIELLSNIPAELREPKRWLQYYEKRDEKHPEKKPGKCPTVKYATPEDREANLRSLDHLLARKLQRKHPEQVDGDDGECYRPLPLDHREPPAAGDGTPPTSEEQNTACCAG